MTLSSSASITALAVLENVKKLDGKTYAFDAHIWVNKDQAIIAGLRFYNREEMPLTDFASYMVVANVGILFFCFPDRIKDISP